MLTIFFNKYCICLYSKVVYEDAHKEAKLLPQDTFLSRKKCVCGRGSAPDPTGGAYSAPPDSIADNGGGASREGRGKARGGEGRREEKREEEGKGRKGMGRERKGKCYPPEQKSWLYGLELDCVRQAREQMSVTGFVTPRKIAKKLSHLSSV